MENELQKRNRVRLQTYDYNTPGAYFLTICTENRCPILSRVVGTGVLDCPQLQLTGYGEIADKYIKQLDAFYEHLSVESYVIMPNHIHLMLVIKENGQSGTPVPTRANSTVSQFVSTLKRFCNKEYGKNIWQSRSHDHIIRNRADHEEHLRYIFENPLRWQSDALYVKE